MDSPLDPALVGVLKRCREGCNQRFAALRHQYPQADGEALQAELAAFVPQLSPLAAEDPRLAETAFETAFALLLDLARQGWLGDKRPGWASTLLAAVPVLARADERDGCPLAAELANAAWRVCRHPWARPERYTRILARVANDAHCRQDWQRIGLVAAWRAGLAHYRTSALAALAELPPATQAMVLELAEGIDPATMVTALATRRCPEALPLPHYRVGGHRHGGGHFDGLPTVAIADGRLSVRVDGSVYEVHADAFGVSLVAMPAGHAPTLTVSPAPPGAWQKQLPAGLDQACSAWDGELVAVAFCDSYRVSILPWH